MTYIFILLILLLPLLGGIFAQYFKIKNRIGELLGFSAGAVLSIALLDLLPEAINISGGVSHTKQIMVFAVLGFLLFFIVENIFHSHSCQRTDNNHIAHEHSLYKSPLAIIALCSHSLLDGMVLGTIVNLDGSKTATLVCLALLLHRFIDGINIVAADNGCKTNNIKKHLPLIINAFAPILGILLADCFSIPKSITPYILSFMAGFFIFLGASDLLPASQKEVSGNRQGISAMVLLGVILISLITFSGV